MPFFVGDATQDNATFYFTAFTLLNCSVTKTREVYRQVFGDPTWPQALAHVLGISLSDVITAKDRVGRAFGGLYSHDLVVHKQGHLYPKRLKDLSGSPEFLFVRGDITLLDEPTVSVVGTRNPSPEGRREAWDLACRLTERHVVVVSGLAFGIDEAAHEGALSVGRTVAVIGTPLNQYYPRAHEALQNDIATKGVVVSQFLPKLPVQKWYFPLRNATMSGLSVATIVVEAGETSGALIQAREALKQGRRVFVPQRAVDNPNLRWPKNYVQHRGAMVFQDINDLMKQLEHLDLIKSLAEPPRRTAIEYATGV